MADASTSSRMMNFISTNWKAFATVSLAAGVAYVYYQHSFGVPRIEPRVVVQEIVDDQGIDEEPEKPIEAPPGTQDTPLAELPSPGKADDKRAKDSMRECEQLLKSLSSAGYFPPPHMVNRLKQLMALVADEVGEEGVTRIRELSAALNSATGEWVFAHELRVNKELKWSSNTGLLNQSMSAREREIAEQMAATMRKSFWDKYKEDLNNTDPPAYHLLIERLSELRQRLCGYLPPARRPAFAARLDLDMVSQQISNQAFDQTAFRDLFKALVDMLYRLESPAQHEKTVDFMSETVMQTVESPRSRTRKEMLQTFHNRLVDSLAFVFAQCDTLDTELERYRVSQISMSERRQQELRIFYQLIEAGAMELVKLIESLKACLADIPFEIIQPLSQAAMKSIKEMAIAQEDAEGDAISPRKLQSILLNKMTGWVHSPTASPLRQISIRSVIQTVAGTVVEAHRLLITEPCEDFNDVEVLEQWEIRVAYTLSTSTLETMRLDIPQLLQMGRSFSAVVELALAAVSLHPLLPQKIKNNEQVMEELFEDLWTSFLEAKGPVSAAGDLGLNGTNNERSIQAPPTLRKRSSGEAVTRNDVVAALMRAGQKCGLPSEFLTPELSASIERSLKVACFPPNRSEGNAMAYKLMSDRCAKALKDACILSMKNRPNMPTSPKPSPLSPSPTPSPSEPTSPKQDLIPEDALGKGPPSLNVARKKLEKLVKERVLTFTSEHLQVYLPLYVEVLTSLLWKRNKENGGSNGNEEIVEEEIEVEPSPKPVGPA